MSTPANPAVATPRTAVVLTLAYKEEDPNGGYNGKHNSKRLRCLLNGTISSLRATGFHGDILCQVAGFEDATTQFGQYCSSVISLPVPDFDAGPTFDDQLAQRDWMRKRGRVPPPNRTRVQFNWKRSGALTAVKLHAWTLTQYDMVLHTDVDVRFLENPRDSLEAAYAKRLIFQAAHAEVGGRMDYVGFNSHLLLLKPSLELHAVLSAAAAQGHFIPYTRTEQDVLESILPQSAPALR